MSDANDTVVYFDRLRARALDELPPLKHSGGDGTSGGMEERVAVLETHMEYVRRDLGEIKVALEKIGDHLKGADTRMSALATKADLWAWKWQWTALAFAVVAIVIGGIIGGLSWIQPEPSPPAPIVVSIPK